MTNEMQPDIDALTTALDKFESTLERLCRVPLHDVRSGEAAKQAGFKFHWKRANVGHRERWLVFVTEPGREGGPRTLRETPYATRVLFAREASDTFAAEVLQAAADLRARLPEATAKLLEVTDRMRRSEIRLAHAPEPITLGPTGREIAPSSCHRCPHAKEDALANPKEVADVLCGRDPDRRVVQMDGGQKPEWCPFHKDY